MLDLKQSSFFGVLSGWPRTHKILIYFERNTLLLLSAVQEVVAFVPFHATCMVEIHCVPDGGFRKTVTTCYSKKNSSDRGAFSICSWGLALVDSHVFRLWESGDIRLMTCKNSSLTASQSRCECNAARIEIVVWWRAVLIHTLATASHQCVPAVPFCACSLFCRLISCLAQANEEGAFAIPQTPAQAGQDAHQL